jgi:hypothetical protein
MAPPLKLVPKAAPSAKEAVRQRVRATPKPATMLQCRCGSREVIEARQGVLLRGGKPSGGSKVLICLNCMLRGERVVVLP